MVLIYLNSNTLPKKTLLDRQFQNKKRDLTPEVTGFVV